MMWLLLIQVISWSQNITVVDKKSSVGITKAEIWCKSSQLKFVTNDLGVVQLNGNTCEEFLVISEGYDTVHISMTALSSSGYMIGLTRSENILEELMVSTYKQDAIQQTSIHIQPLNIDDFENKGAFSISDALTQIPGVSQLSTGIGISKPVIRGLYGNRVLVLMSGLRFDNQQWQDEHGLGLTDLGLAKVELIKGPLSLLYGTDAIGGVINLIEETKPKKGFQESELRSNFHSNTLGGSVSVGYKANYGKYWFRMRLGSTNHCDYTDGSSTRILNSRFNSQNLKLSLGFNKGNWTSSNHYFMSYSKFGFIFSDITHFMEPDKRWSRSMSGPHHIVFLNNISSENTIHLSKSELKLNLGLQSNFRSEDEGGGELSLKMLLLTAQYALKWEKELSKHWQLVLANNTHLENNTNYGRRKIVPDANMLESSASAYLKYIENKIIMEYGIGGGIKDIQTFLTSTVNSSEKDIAPFHQNRTFMNTMIGASIIPSKTWNLKLNLSTGVRAPNLAELSANGLHEGIYTYEIGDPNMNNERNANVDLGIYHTGKTFGFTLSGFYNYFIDYIYLQPTEDNWYGFPVSKFVQYNASIYGAEASCYFSPERVKGLKFSGAYSFLIGQLENREFLPYMPANKITPELRYETTKNENKWFVFANTNFVMQQELVNTYENQTPSYFLVNAGAGINWSKRKANYSLKLIGNNLLNEAYYDHMSRFKNFGLLNIGRDISIQFNINFKNHL